ncbi:glycosyltransferase family 25 protein [Caenimonas sedimenti]|uniref:Glycosyltransferase family 25 protein n=1 Tax=Caenimonas sedimenti TaxID=2596921 RepID=A0A562ZPT1_9BURK|nr:glycosyltransferase family 25 protein [Caenimonas sedimenti]TWO70580.1 glycosyltransferase family 25 protein [Caenimonas sedimenti]
MQTPLLAGYFINLDRSTARAEFMRAQLERLGMRWVQRAAAIDGAQVSPPAGCRLLPGEYACFLSHLQVLERAPPDAFTLVLEDDTELSDQLPQVLAMALQSALPAFDVALLECQPHFSLEHVSALWDTASRFFVGGTRRIKGVDLMDAAMYFKWGTPAYLVPPGGRGAVLDVLRAGLAEGPTMPLDECMRSGLVGGKLRGVITIPFLATTGLQWHGRSDIGNGARMPDDSLMVLRRLLYAGSLGDAESLARSFAAAPADPGLQMFGAVLRELAAHQRMEAQAEIPPLTPAPAASPAP